MENETKILNKKSVGNFNLDTDEQKEWYSISTNRSSEHLGDCLELMPLIADESIDMILCDLPYGTTACKWDTIIPFNKLWEQYERIIKPNGAIVLTASQPFTSALIMSNTNLFKHELIWDKVKTSQPHLSKIKPMQRHENILVFGRGKITYNPIMILKNKPRKAGGKRTSKDNEHKLGLKTTAYYLITHSYPDSFFIASNADNTKRQHPTEKPLKLFVDLIKTYSNENEIILDNTAGVFTTAIACLETNRKYIVMEKEKEYYNKGLKRILEWEREQKTKLF